MVGHRLGVDAGVGESRRRGVRRRRGEAREGRGVLRGDGARPMGRSPSARVSPSGTPVAEGADTRGSLAIVATALPVELPQRRGGARACGWGGVHSRGNQASGRVVAVQCRPDGVRQAHRREPVATLDQDATLSESHKEQALFCYKGFRDGTAPAGFQQLRVLKEALELLPEGVEEVCLRSDTAGYQWELLRYCEEGKNLRFGRIEFAVGVDITDASKRAGGTARGRRGAATLVPHAGDTGLRGGSSRGGS